MADIQLLDATYDARASYNWDLDKNIIPSTNSISFFDNVGYLLTKLESEYALINGFKTYSTINYNCNSIMNKWFDQQSTSVGAIINFAFILERKSFESSAKKQIETWSKTNPIFYKLLKINSKWGFKFSIDWIDTAGNVLEILNYSFNDNNYHKVIDAKQRYEKLFLNMDWDDAGRSILNKKSHWIDLDLQLQRDWKCDFLGIDKEKNTVILWKE